MSATLLRLTVRVLPRGDRARYLRELTAEQVSLPSGWAQNRFGWSHLLHAYGLRRALVGPRRSGTALGAAPVDKVAKAVRCRMHVHDMVWFSTPDGGRWKHCSRCGEDSGAGGSAMWSYDMGNKMGF